MSGAKGKEAGSGCLILFSLPFAGVGVGMVVLIAHSLYAAWEASHWETCPATILSVNLREHHGDDSTTYSVEARYRYTYRSQTYEGDRVALDAGSDNFGSFHQDLARDLRRHLEQEEPWPCYVNPDRPAEALLVRDLRIGKLALFALFGLLFGGAGFGLMIFAIRNHRREKQTQSASAAHPEAPWLWKREWQNGAIRSSNRNKFITAVFITAVWNLLSWGAVIGGWDKIQQEKGLALIVFAFPVVGLLLLGWAIRAAVRWLKYGESTFELAEVPGVIGGQLGGVIHTQINIDPEDGFHLTLACLHLVTTGSGKNRSTTEKTLWQDEKVMARELMDQDTTRSAIPVLFAIPFDCLPTNPKSRRFWRLTVEARVPGVDYKASFEVPVFRTEKSDPDFELDTSLTEGLEAVVEGTRGFAAEGIRVEPTAQGQRFVFPMGRNLGAALGMTVFALIWTAICVGLALSDAPLLFPIVFGLFDLLFLAILASLWFESRRIEVAPDSITLSGGLFGCGTPRTFPRERIRSIRCSQSMQSGSTTWFNVVLVETDGTEHTAAGNVRGRQTAEALAAELERTEDTP